MATVSQPSRQPTNKVSAATITTALVAVSGLALKNLAPQWYDPEVMLSMTPVLLFVVAWFVPDAPNIVVVTEEPKQ